MKKKLISIYIFIITICVLLTVFVQFSYEKQLYMDEIKNRVKANAYFTRWSMENGKPPYTKAIASLAKSTHSRITVVKETGTVLYDSEKNPEKLVNHRNRPEIKKAFRGKVAFSIRYSTSIGKKMLYCAIPADKKTNPSVIRLSIPLNYIYTINKRFLGYTAFDIIIGILAGVLVSYLYTLRISKPIREMVETSKYIANGNFDTKLKIQEDQDIYILSVNFNIMVDKLNSVINELKTKNIEAEALLNSMISGVIGIDQKLKVRYVNETARQMLKFTDDVDNMIDISEVIKSDEFRDRLLEGFLIGQSYNRILIGYGNSFLKIHVSMIGEREGAVLVIQDVTEEKNYNDMRTQFVANVSHELRTPLTSILGFIETLKDMEDEDNESVNRFLGIIEAEAKRLQNLINDILELSYMENGNAVDEKGEFSLHDVISEVTVLLSKISLSKSIELNYNCSKDIILIADRGKVKQMLINLVDNAIKYTPSGGKVDIFCAKSRGEVKIWIKDTGIGISKEHLSRLFERFYRVDKSRSRAIGGTGLGLSIVKHIVMNLDGKIEVDSEVNKGTTFYIRIPV